MAGKLCAILVVVLSFASVQSHAESAEAEKSRIDHAWDEVYKNIGWLTQYLRNLTADGSATERFEAYRTLRKR